MECVCVSVRVWGWFSWQVTFSRKPELTFGHVIIYIYIYKIIIMIIYSVCMGWNISAAEV